MSKTGLEKLRVYGEPVRWSAFDVYTLHPLADESELLARLGVGPDECESCDLYWARGDDLVFVSVAAADSPAVAVYRRENIEDGLTFLVRTLARPLTTDHIETAMGFLSAWLDSNEPMARSAGEEVVRIAGSDVAT